MHHRLTMTIALLLAMGGLVASPGALAADPEVTMEVIEEPDARDLAGSHSLELPEPAAEGATERRREDGDSGEDRDRSEEAQGLSDEARGPGSAREAAQELAEEARQQGRDAREDRGRSEIELPDAANEAAGDGQPELPEQAQDRPAANP